MCLTNLVQEFPSNSDRSKTANPDQTNPTKTRAARQKPAHIFESKTKLAALNFWEKSSLENPLLRREFQIFQKTAIQLAAPFFAAAPAKFQS